MVETIMQVAVIGFIVAFICEWVYVTFIKD